MRKSTIDALAKLDAWRKSYKKWRWIKNVLCDFYDAYCCENSPVGFNDKPEINRLLAKFEAYEEKADIEFSNVGAEIPELRKRFRRNKTVMARLEEIGHYIAVNEGFIIPD